jgi:hypothetical protein
LNNELWNSECWDIEGMKCCGEIPLKNGEFILNSERICEKYWLLHAQTESFAMNFETMEIQRAFKIGGCVHII